MGAGFFVGQLGVDTGDITRHRTSSIPFIDARTGDISSRIGSRPVRHDRLGADDVTALARAPKKGVFPRTVGTFIIYIL